MNEIALEKHWFGLSASISFLQHKTRIRLLTCFSSLVLFCSFTIILVLYLQIESDSFAWKIQLFVVAVADFEADASFRLCGNLEDVSCGTVLISYRDIYLSQKSFVLLSCADCCPGCRLPAFLPACQSRTCRCGQKLEYENYKPHPF